MADVEKVQVVLEAKIEAFKRAIQNIQRVTRKAFQDINKEMASARPPEYNQALSQVERMRTSMRLYAASAKVASGAFKYTDEFVSMSQDLQQSTADAAALRQQLEQLNRYADAAEASGDWDMAEGYRANAAQVSEQLQMVERRADSVRVAIARLAQEGKLTKFAGAAAVLKRIGSALGGVAKQAGQLAGGVIRRAGGAFSSLIHRMSEGISHMRLFGRSAGNAGIGLGNLTRSIFNAQLALKLLSSAARWVKSAVVEGLRNLQTAMPTSAAANSINQLTASLSQLRNAIGAAAAPILSAIAPALNTLINLAITAANAVGALFAALTGQKFVAATTGAAGVAGALGGAADNAGAANENAQKLKRTLMGFDQINKLDDADSSSGGSGSGSGGGGGGVVTGFEEAEIPAQIQAFADKIKAAWANADFTEIGTMVGEKLITALNKIPWSEIQKTAEKGAKSLATFLNGFLDANVNGDTIGSSLGETLANAVNTAFLAVNTFATNFKWDSLGKAVSDGINSFFKNWNWKLSADTVSNVAKGILDAITTAIQNTDWSSVGQKVRYFLTNIDWAGIAQSLFKAIGSGFGGLAAFLGGLLGDSVSEAKKYFQKKVEECGGNVVAGILKGITDAISNISKWIKTNIFDPFVEGFKKTFGIASPAKTMKPLGTDIIDGVLAGMKAAITTIKEWIFTLPAKFKKWFSKVKGLTIEIGAKISTKASDMWSNLKTRWNNIKGKTVELGSKISTTASSMRDELKGRWNSINGKVLSFNAKIGQTASSMRDELKGRWNTIGGKVLGFGAKISDTAHKVSDEFHKLWNGRERLLTFKAKISSKARDVWGEFKTRWSGLTTNVSAKVNLVKGWKGSLTRFVTGKDDGKFKGGTGVISRAKQWTSTFKEWITGRKDGTMTGVTEYVGRALDPKTDWTWAGWMKAITGNKSGQVSGIGAVVTNKWVGGTADWTWAGWMKTIVGNAAGIVTGITAVVTNKIRGNAGGGILTASGWQPVTAAAGGGSFSMGQMFIAREAGPELVGTIGGNTAVMNNDQIVSSVAAGVAQAVASVMSAFVSQMNSGGDVTVYIDGDELTTAVVRGMRRSDKRNNPKVVFGG